MKKTVIALMFAFCSQVSAGYDLCVGEVDKLIADYGCADGQIAYKLKLDTDGSSTDWICTQSTQAGSVVMVAATTGKKIRAQVPDPDNSISCNSIQSFTVNDFVQLLIE